MLKKILVFILVLALAVPIVQFNFGIGGKKAYADVVQFPSNVYGVEYDNQNNLWTLVVNATSSSYKIDLYKNGVYVRNVLSFSYSTYGTYYMTLYDMSNFDIILGVNTYSGSSWQSYTYYYRYNFNTDTLTLLKRNTGIDRISYDDGENFYYFTERTDLYGNKIILKYDNNTNYNLAVSVNGTLYAYPGYNVSNVTSVYLGKDNNLYFAYSESYVLALIKFDIANRRFSTIFSYTIPNNSWINYTKIRDNCLIFKENDTLKKVDIDMGQASINSIPNINNMLTLVSSAVISGDIYLSEASTSNYVNYGSFNANTKVDLAVPSTNTVYKGFVWYNQRFINYIYNVTSGSTFNLRVSNSGALSWSNDLIKRGSGYVVLSWNPIGGATGYKVWVFDGYQYRAFDVGNTTSWDSRVWRIWPDMNWLNSQGDNTISTDVFNHVKGGGQLPDDPNLLYRKTVGTTYDNAHNYWFRVSAYNQYGESPMSDAVMPTLPNMTDPNSPTITSFTINDGAAKTGSPQLKLSISASDTGGSGLSKIEISTDNFQTIQQTVNILPIGTNPTIGPNTYSVTIDNFQVPATPGTVSVYARVWDVAGNVSSVQKAQIALVNDMTPPTAQLKINNGAEFITNPNVTLYITAYDDWTPIDHLLMRLSNDGKNWTSWSPLALTMNWTLDSSTQGYKTVFLQVQDASANIGTTSAGILYSTDPNVIRSTQLDTEPPKVDYLGLARGATVTTSYTPTITIVASDNVTPQNQLHVYASADGINWVDLGYLTSANKTLPSGLVQNGYNTIQIKIVDSSFNETIKTLSFFKL